jgi:hypothetical protein
MGLHMLARGTTERENPSTSTICIYEPPQAPLLGAPKVAHNLPFRRSRNVRRTPCASAKHRADGAVRVRKEGHERKTINTMSRLKKP